MITQLIAFSNPLRPLEHFLQHILIWLHVTVGFTWAWSIVALTVLVRILLVPVTVKQIHSMQNLQAHAPEMKALQQKWKHDKQRQNEELMKFYRENKINPAASCLPMVLQIPIFISLFYVLRHFDERVLPHYGGSVDWLHLVDITQPVKDGWGPLLLVIYVASQLSSSYFMSSTMQGAQRILLMVLPGAFRPLHSQVSRRPDALLADHQPVDDRAGPRHAQAHAQAGIAREAELSYSREGRARGGGRQRLCGRARQGGCDPCPQAGCRPATQGQAQDGRRRDEAMTDEITVEATGETVGEAKWTALRELQRRVPGLDRDAIRFQVVSEGERGLLGVGYTPASVVATVDTAGLPAPATESQAARRARLHSSASCSSGRSRRAACPRRFGSTKAATSWLPHSSARISAC